MVVEVFMHDEKGITEDVAGDGVCGCDVEFDCRVRNAKREDLSGMERGCMVDRTVREACGEDGHIGECAGGYVVGEIEILAALNIRSALSSAVMRLENLF